VAFLSQAPTSPPMPSSDHHHHCEQQLQIELPEHEKNEQQQQPLLSQLPLAQPCYHRCPLKFLCDLDLPPGAGDKKLLRAAAVHIGLQVTFKCTLSYVPAKSYLFRRLFFFQSNGKLSFKLFLRKLS